MAPTLIECIQGSDEWRMARLGIPTASEFSTVMAMGEGKTRRAYLTKLAGEIITGDPMPSYTNQAMERGKIQEQEARDYYAFITNAKPQLVGFIVNGRKGCSPDALIGDDGLLEIKTAEAHVLIEILLRGTVPPEHVAQLQGNLWVSEREWIDLAIYCPKMPMFKRRVRRDEAYIARLALAVDVFLNDLDSIVEQIRRRQ